MLLVALLVALLGREQREEVRKYVKSLDSILVKNTHHTQQIASLLKQHKKTIIDLSTSSNVNLNLLLLLVVVY